MTVVTDSPFVNSGDLLSMGAPIGLTEHVVVFEILHGSSRWWAWCFVDLSGAGFSRIRWSRPGGKTEAPPDGLEFGGVRSQPPLFAFDTPVVSD